MSTLNCVNPVNPLVSSVNPTQNYISLNYLNKSKKEADHDFYDTAILLFFQI
jgi:lysine/ornithine N-monooxygenase